MKGFIITNLKRTIIITIFAFLAFTPIMNVFAEEIAEEPVEGGAIKLSSDVNVDYSRDAQILVKIYCDPSIWTENITMGSLIRLDISDVDTGQEYTSVHNEYELDEDGMLTINVWLPEGHYFLDWVGAYNQMRLTYICYQTELIAEKGKIYETMSVTGYPDWVNENKDLIPSYYSTVGEVCPEYEMAPVSVTDQNGERVKLNISAGVWNTMSAEEQSEYISKKTGVPVKGTDGNTYDASETVEDEIDASTENTEEVTEVEEVVVAEEAEPDDSSNNISLVIIILLVILILAAIGILVAKKIRRKISKGYFEEE